MRYDLRMFLSKYRKSSRAVGEGLRNLLCIGLLMAGPASAAETRPGWKTYTDSTGHYSINYPEKWQPITRGDALVISSPGEAATRGVFGITRRTGDVTAPEAVAKEFESPDRPADLQQGPAKMGDRPAIKVWGSKKGDPNIRVVEYYLQKDRHTQYYILFQAPHAMMSKYGPIFNRMIGSIQFLN
jgi:hypothetical protein